MTAFEHACLRVETLEGEIRNVRKEFYAMQNERDSLRKKVLLLENKSTRCVAGLEGEIQTIRREYDAMRNERDTLLKNGSARSR